FDRSFSICRIACAMPLPQWGKRDLPAGFQQSGVIDVIGVGDHTPQSRVAVFHGRDQTERVLLSQHTALGPIGGLIRFLVELLLGGLIFLERDAERGSHWYAVLAKHGEPLV